MNAPETVSVIIPCHNAEDWIEETLRSALEQEGIEIEVVVVDDGSTDKSIERVQGVGDERVIVVQQAQAGASRARTMGTARSRGPFLQYLDADDVLLPGALRARVDALVETDADVAYSDWVRYEQGPGGEFREAEVNAKSLGPQPEIQLFTDAWWPPGALLYRRSIVERIGAWREDLPIIQDARFQLDAALMGAQFVHTPGIALRYRVRGGTSLSRRDPRAFLEDCYLNARQIHSRWERDGGLDSERRRALVKVYGHLARAFYPVDRSRFREITQEFHVLAPGQVPGGHWPLRLVSRVLGYPRAEWVASVWRDAKRLAGWW
jgi:glycosyltransferase involved in cell wall biosynthesis